MWTANLIPLDMVIVPTGLFTTGLDSSLISHAAVT